MRGQHVDDQPLAVLAVIRDPTYEVEWTGLIKLNNGLPINERGDWIYCNAMVVSFFIHHKH